jgi:Mu transposase, C-terminal domain
LFVDPARVRHPRDKPRVENQVAYVRENWFAGEEFRDLDDARESAATWSRDVAGRRIHGTTRQVPLEVFEGVEKAGMLPPPDAPFDVPLWTHAKVHADHHIQVGRALYSVPTLYLHKRVRVRADKKLVRIYLGTQLIKTHPRQLPGRRSTDAADYPVGKAAYAMRSVDHVIERARSQGHHVGQYAGRVLAGPLPWARMRQAYALLALREKYGAGRVEAACQTALAFDVIDVPRIKRMLATAARPTPATPDNRKVIQLPLPRFARDAKQFETRASKEEAE